MKQSSGLTGKLFPNEAQVTYLLRTYRRIKQPEAWKHWVEARTTDNPPPLAQKLANDAVAYANTLQQEGNWSPKKQTIEAQIQAMMAQHLDKYKKRKDAPDAGKENNSAKRRTKDPPKQTGQKKDPPFLTDRKDKDGKEYKVGDTKKWNSKDFHYCDCPNHKRNGAWHLFTAEQCRTRAKWLKSGKKDSPKDKKKAAKPAVEGNVADMDDEGNQESNGDDPSEREELMSMMGDLFKEAVDDDARGKIGQMMEMINKM